MGQTATAKQLLFIVERGGYPLPSERFTDAGYIVTVEHSMRKALTRVRGAMPDIIVAEFNFGPKYGDRISNLEPLLASVQAAGDRTKIIVFVEAEYRHHLERLRAHFSIFDALSFPWHIEQLEAAVARAAQALKD